MADLRRRAPEPSLEDALRDLARYVSYPETPDLAARIEDAVRRAGAVDRQPMERRPLRRGLVLALIGLLIIAGAAAAVGIGLRGLSIVFIESPPRGGESPLDLGEPMTLADAQALVAYEILLPTGRLGQPDEIYVDERRSIEQVALVYREAGAVELLITQFEAIPQLTPAVKEVGPGTRVEAVRVDGKPGFWIEGNPHLLRYRDPRGAAVDDPVRLVGNVLVWQRGELTLRIEGASSREEAISIAESME